MFHLGNCLELAANGILNHVKCHNFTLGCPDKPYLSDEIYRCKYFSSSYLVLTIWLLKISFKYDNILRNQLSFYSRYSNGLIDWTVFESISLDGNVARHFEKPLHFKNIFQSAFNYTFTV